MRAYLIALHYMDDPTGFVVDFGPDPAASRERFGSLERAVDRCYELNSFRVRMGAHQCAFAVAPLPEGDFGIVCTTHLTS